MPLKKKEFEHGAGRFACLFSVFLAVVIMGGCSKYHNLPLDRESVSERLTPPAMETIKVEAKAVKHPILKPLSIDARDGFSPEEAALIAVLINPKLRAQRDRKGVAAAQLFQAGILPNPQLSYSLQFPTGGNTEGTVSTFGFGLGYDIKQLVTRGPHVEASTRHAESVDLDVAWQEWQVAQAARQHVYRLVLLKEQLTIAEDGEKGLKKNRDAVKKAVDWGDMTAITLSAAEAALQSVHLTVLDTRQQLVREQLALNQTMGFPPEQKVLLQTTPPVPEIETLPSVETMVKGMEDRRLDLLALKMGYESQDARLRAAVKAQFPSINIGFLHSRDNTNVISTGFSVSVDLPFFDRNQGRIAIQEATRKQLFDEYVDRIFKARANVATLRSDISSLKQRILTTKERLPILGDVVKRYQLALLEGSADVLTYYNAVNQLITEKLRLLRLRQKLVDRKIALEIAAGMYLGGLETNGERRGEAN